MSRLIDKSVILLLCLLALGLSDNFAAPVASLLIAMAGSSLVQIFSGTKKAEPDPALIRRAAALRKPAVTSPRQTGNQPSNTGSYIRSDKR